MLRPAKTPTSSTILSCYAALERRLDGSSKAPLVVALSGGGDSLALLHLTLDWATPRGRSVLALTVDHGLQEGSDQWTAEAGAKARALGADWRGLAWTGDKPAIGLPAAARRARHTLLAEAARELGAYVIMMGHTANDIAEGEVMRGSDTPGLGRLREWSPSPVWPDGRGVFLLRPLLSVSRADLRAFLNDRGETWFDDPANDDLRHPRVRARRALKGSLEASSHTLEPDPALPALARRIVVAPDGSMAAPRSTFDEAPIGSAAHVLAAALLCVSGSSRPPRGEPLRRLLAGIVSSKNGALTLAGCRVALADQTARIARQPPRRGVVPKPPEPIHWITERFAAACGLITCEAEAEAGARR